MSDQSVRLSKLTAHALRHEPWVYELELDEAGWVPLDELLSAVRSTHGFGQVGRDDIVEMVTSSPKRRYEVVGDRIRALYGHSVSGRIVKVPAEPPEVLFHGTSPAAAQIIQKSGLVPMGRQYVHLSADQQMAEQVGSRKASSPVILQVSARQAGERGIPFWRGNEFVWLADVIPPEFIVALA